MRFVFLCLAFPLVVLACGDSATDGDDSSSGGSSSGDRSSSSSSSSSGQTSSGQTSSGETTSSSSSGGGACAPGASESCGCGVGTRTCKADGSGFGECNGPTTCTGQFMHGATFSGANDSNQLVSRAAPAPNDGAYVVGTFDGEAVFGQARLTHSGSWPFLTRVDATGGVLWAKAPTGTGTLAGAPMVASGADGSVVIAGIADGTFDFGTGTVGAGTQVSPYVAGFDADGSARWAHKLESLPGSEGPRQSLAWGLARCSDGSTYLAGSFYGGLRVGETLLDSEDAWTSDALLVRYDAQGALVWAKAYGGAATSEELASIACDAQGGVFVVVTHSETIDLGTGPLTPLGGGTASLAHIGSDGTPIWAKVLVRNRGDGSPALASNADSVLFWSNNTVDGFDPIAGATGGPIFISMDHTGNVRWQKVYGSRIEVADVALDASGNLLLTGGFEGDVTFVDQVVSGREGEQGDSYDSFAAKLSHGGAPLWAHAATDLSSGIGRQQFGVGLALTTDGGAWFAAAFRGVADFGAGPITGVDDPGGQSFDSHLFRLSP